MRKGVRRGVEDHLAGRGSGGVLSSGGRVERRVGWTWGSDAGTRSKLDPSMEGEVRVRCFRPPPPPPPRPLPPCPLDH